MNEVFKYLIINCETLDAFWKDPSADYSLVTGLYDVLGSYSGHTRFDTLDKDFQRMIYEDYRKEVVQCWNKDKPNENKIRINVWIYQALNGKIHLAYGDGNTALSLKQILDLGIDTKQIEDFNFDKYQTAYKLTDE